MEDDTAISSSCVFHGNTYMVTMQVVPPAGSLMVEVEDRLSADQWRATFEPSYVEDLTHKTGNFKQFSIFVSMLESALTKATDSVSLDLLTYSDLELLRQRKGSTISSIPSARTATLNTKRYLILTYTVEFDRIHYPLPLPYAGKPDPRALQDTIRELRAQIKSIKGQTMPDYKQRELEKLRREVKALQREKEEMEEEYVQFRREMRLKPEGQFVKEIRMLKTVVKNLEEELMKEKSHHQRISNKRGKEYRDLLEEVDELRASERNLQIRVKNLTNELSIVKKQPIRPSRSISRDRPNNRQNSSRQNSSRDRTNLSRERSLSIDSSYNRNRSQSQSRPNSAPTSRNNSYEPSTSFGRGGRQWIPRSRSPSPAGFSKPRFDPTAYVKEKKRLTQESTSKRYRQVRTNLSVNSGITNRKRYSPRTFNTEKNSVLSQGEDSDAEISESSYSGLRITNGNGGLRNGKRSNNRSQSSAYRSSPGLPRKDRPSSANRKHILASTPDSARERYKPSSETNNKDSNSDRGGESDFYDRSAEISEIDARLQRLQEMMKTSLP